MQLITTPDDYAEVATHTGYAVLSFAKTMIWRDGSSLDLHSVTYHGNNTPWLRAHIDPATRAWVIADIRDLTPTSFEGEMRTLPCRDHHGLLLYTLRASHPNAAAYCACALPQHLATWPVPPAQPTTTPHIPAPRHDHPHHATA